MSRNYDNWERLVDAVLRRDLIWRLCHQQSRTPSLRSSVSSDFSSSFSRSTPASSNLANPGDRLFKSALPLPFQTVAAGVRNEIKSVTREYLVLFGDSLLVFGLEELLMAPCFLLGDEVKTFSSAYVVRFKENVVLMKVFKREWLLNQRWKVIQSLERENVVRLMGFFINGQGGIFGIYEYFHQGSLHTMLHGGVKGDNQVDLDWEARIRIAIGVAKGLLHIHKQGGNFVHGSVKASNVFINSEQYGCLDVKPDYDISLEIKMCHAPEVRMTKVVSHAGDVYSFGVVLIELVNGRSPLHYTGRDETFAEWGLQNARDELMKAMVSDRNQVVKYSLAKQAMWDLLGVASSCVKEKPEERPKMNDVVEMLENKFC